MSKPTTIYVCTNCDAQSSKWAGRCFECGGWGTLQVNSAAAVEAKNKKSLTLTPLAKTTPFTEITGQDVTRIPTGMTEFDQVLGGGIVPGSLILIGGEPGIGKSTLLLQIAMSVGASTNQNILYCSGEESAQQIKLRLDRLTEAQPQPAPPATHLYFLGETNVEAICAAITTDKPRLAIIDSIQTINSQEIPSESGSLAQVRACTVKLLEVAKLNHIPIIIVGHVTKDGMVAGPKTLEHLVDTVLYLESDHQNYFRLLKTVKNRFGSTNEVGIFEMGGAGLQEVSNPSEAFLGEQQSDAPGTITTAVIEGSRAFLIQVQALTTKTYFGYPQRRAVGFDTNRLQLLIAVLTKRAGLNLGDQDIHLNVVGGFKISEPAIDLAVCMSIISAYHNRTFGPRAIVFGEVGLNGEIRPVPMTEKRIKEAEKLGYTTIILPDGKLPKDTKSTLIPLKTIQDIDKKL